MKIKKSTLKQLIQEEYANILLEQTPGDVVRSYEDPGRQSRRPLRRSERVRYNPETDEIEDISRETITFGDEEVEPIRGYSGLSDEELERRLTSDMPPDQPRAQERGNWPPPQQGEFGHHEKEPQAAADPRPQPGGWQWYDLPYQALRVGRDLDLGMAPHMQAAIDRIDPLYQATQQEETGQFDNPKTPWREDLVSGFEQELGIIPSFSSIARLPGRIRQGLQRINPFARSQQQITADLPPAPAGARRPGVAGAQAVGRSRNLPHPGDIGMPGARPSREAGDLKWEEMGGQWVNPPERQRMFQEYWGDISRQGLSTEELDAIAKDAIHRWDRARSNWAALPSQRVEVPGIGEMEFANRWRHSRMTGPTSYAGNVWISADERRRNAFESLPAEVRAIMRSSSPSTRRNIYNLERQGFRTTDEMAANWPIEDPSGLDEFLWFNKYHTPPRGPRPGSEAQPRMTDQERRHLETLSAEEDVIPKRDDVYRLYEMINKEVDKLFVA